VDVLLEPVTDQEEDWKDYRQELTRLFTNLTLVTPFADTLLRLVAAELEKVGEIIQRGG
jgi:hypothetical protein